MTARTAGIAAVARQAAMAAATGIARTAAARRTREGQIDLIQIIGNCSGLNGIDAASQNFEDVDEFGTSHSQRSVGCKGGQDGVGRVLALVDRRHNLVVGIQHRLCGLFDIGVNQGRKTLVTERICIPDICH